MKLTSLLQLVDNLQQAGKIDTLQQICNKPVYSRFQITFHNNIPSFVAKFGNSLRSSKVHFRIHKPVCKILNFATNFRSSQRISELRNEFPEYYSEKSAEIDSNPLSIIEFDFWVSDFQRIAGLDDKQWTIWLIT